MRRIAGSDRRNAVPTAARYGTPLAQPHRPVELTAIGLGRRRPSELEVAGGLRSYDTRDARNAFRIHYDGLSHPEAKFYAEPEEGD